MNQVLLIFLINMEGITMRKFEVVYAEIIEAEDFFDAVEKAKRIGREILSVSEAPEEIDDEYVFD